MNEKNGQISHKAAMVGVVGRTNAGKSTIVNRLVGEKVSIVSPVEQTTRNTIRGIVADPRGQLVLIDTPGLHKAVGPLGRLLNGMARASSAGVDILLVVFDASHEPQLEDEGWMCRVDGDPPERLVLALNKSDRKPFFGDMFRNLWKDVAKSGLVPTWVETCGVKPGGCDALLDALFGLAEEGPALFPDDVVTDYPRRLAIADVIREKLLSHLRDEVPHETGVAVASLVEHGRTWNVSVAIHVNRPSQKGMVIGARASVLKSVRLAAEPELSDMFGVNVRLDLRVKVTPRWMEDRRLLAEMGYLGAVR